MSTSEVKGRRLVVDACVARGAGKVNNPGDCRPRACRRTLLAIDEGQNTVVLTPYLDGEWREWASPYSVLWRTKMVSRRRFIVLASEPEDSEVRFEALALAEDPIHEARIRKDLPLLLGALVTDRSIISVEKKIERNFVRLAERLPKVRDVIWVNPEVDEEKALQWLVAGAPFEAERCLGHSCS